ncbi:MAG TPA: hypothetical protein ENI05_02170 [Porticoccus sp.]|nr:hypothetical protein [Porticoccus sp.]
MAGWLATTANRNVCIGYQSAYSLTTGWSNVLVGTDAGSNLTEGLENTLFGHLAGFGITTESNNTMIGSYAGYDITAAYTLVIDCRRRGPGPFTSGLTPTHSIIYGIMADEPENQTLDFNIKTLSIGHDIVDDVIINFKTGGNSGLLTWDEGDDAFIFSDDVVIGSTFSLIVDTNTLVANLTGYTDKVGIGTATPADILDVLKAGTQLRLSYDASNYFTFAVQSDGDLTVDSNKASYDLDFGDGNLTTTGIGSFSKVIIDSDNTEALLVRQDGDALDVLKIDTTGASQALIIRQAADNQGIRLHGFGNVSAFSFNLYLDANGTGNFVTSGLMNFDAGSGGDTALNFYGSEHTFGRYGNTNNAPNRFYGYITGGGHDAKRYLEILIDDSDDFAHLSLDPAGGILGIKLDAEVVLPSDGLTLAADDVKLAIGASGTADSYFEWNETTYSKLRAYSATGIYDFTAAGNTDITFNFIGTDSSGRFDWDEDNDRFSFFNDILTSGKIHFRDTATGIYSLSPNILDIFAVTATRIGDSAAGAPTNYANFSATGDFSLVGSAQVVSDLPFADTKAVVFDKASGNGIKVDTTTPTFGWRDLLGDQFAKNTGGTKPTLTAYNGDVDAWQFSDGDEAFLTYHIPHDYVAGTDIYLHVHWSQTSATATGGTIDFKYFAIYSKGHNQTTGSAFTTTPITALFSSININDGASGLTRYQQHFTEVVISETSTDAKLSSCKSCLPHLTRLRRYLSNNILSHSASVYLGLPFLSFSSLGLPRRIAARYSATFAPGIVLVITKSAGIMFSLRVKIRGFGLGCYIRALIMNIYVVDERV